MGGGVLLGILGGVVLAGSPNPDPISGAALKQGIRNPESGIRKRKRNTESNINDSKLKNFTLRNLSTIQREFVLVFLAVPLNIFLLLCLDKVCRSVGYCTARPMKVILRVMFIHEFMG